MAVFAFPPNSLKHRSTGNLSLGHTFFIPAINYTPNRSSVIGRSKHQVTSSRNNMGFAHLGGQFSKEFNLDIGGPFRTRSIEVIADHSRMILDNEGQPSLRHIVTCTGLYPSSEILEFLTMDFSDRSSEWVDSWMAPRTPALLTFDELCALGATAISRVQPMDPVADSATNVAELLREGLPSVPGTQGNPGSEYLNYQFGIAPTLSFAQDAIKAYRESTKILNQIRRDSGKLVRRRYEFEEDRTTTSTSATGRVTSTIDGSTPSGNVSDTGTLTKVVHTSKKVWFSGAFTYHFPEGGWSEKLAEWESLYGVQPGVDTLYELVPWSWLVDYFSNVGDVLGNLNAFAMNGVVMPWGYIMCTQQEITEYTWQGNLCIKGTWGPHTLKAEVKRVTKQRLPATPWGFGLKTDLTDQQVLILAALGISRV